MSVPKHFTRKGTTILVVELISRNKFRLFDTILRRHFSIFSILLSSFKNKKKSTEKLLRKSGENAISSQSTSS